MLTLLGIFETYQPASWIPGLQVYDLRKKKEGAALWAFLRFEQDSVIVLLQPPANSPPIGKNFSGSQYLGPRAPEVKIDVDARLALWWGDKDASRSGLHGTQHYAGLATSRRGNSFELHRPVSRGSFGWEKLGRTINPKKQSFDLQVGENIKISFRKEYPYRSGVSYGKTAPAVTTVWKKGKKTIQMEGDYFPIAVYNAISGDIGAVEEAELFVADICRPQINGRYNVLGIEALTKRDARVGLIEVSPLFADCFDGECLVAFLTIPQQANGSEPEKVSLPKKTAGGQEISLTSIESLASQWGARIKK